MAGGPRSSRSSILSVAVGAALLDWISKFAVVVAVEPDTIELPLGGAVRVSRNAGIAFGLGSSAPSWMVLAITIAVSVAMVLVVARGQLPSAIGAGLIAGGAIGNVADRAIGGTVVDFIDLGWWPSFNLADVYLTAGVVLTLFASRRSSAEADSADADRSL